MLKLLPHLRQLNAMLGMVLKHYTKIHQTTCWWLKGLMLTKAIELMMMGLLAIVLSHGLFLGKALCQEKTLPVPQAAVKIEMI